jgi:hypothetical protein
MLVEPVARRVGSKILWPASPSAIPGRIDCDESSGLAFGCVFSDVIVSVFSDVIVRKGEEPRALGHDGLGSDFTRGREFVPAGAASSGSIHPALV